MAISTKNDKVILIVNEEQKTMNNRYLINGIDLGKAVFYFRREFQTFEELTAGNFRIVDVANNKYVEITDTTINAEMIAFQVGYQLTFSSGEYNPTFDTDIEVLRKAHNKLVLEARDLWNVVKKQIFITDSMRDIGVLPYLKENEIWVKTKDGWRGMNIRAFEYEVDNFWKDFELKTAQAKSDITDHKDTEVAKFDQHVEQVSKPAVKAYGEAEMDKYLQGPVKAEITTYTGTKKTELDAYEKLKETELNNYTGTKKQELDDKFNEMKMDNGIIPANTASIRLLGYGRWWTDNITVFPDGPVLPITNAVGGTLDIEITRGLKVFKFYATDGNIVYCLQTSSTTYTDWLETSASDPSALVVGNLGQNFLFSAIAWNSSTNRYEGANPQIGADAIVVKGNTPSGVAYFDSRVKIPAGATDDKGRTFVDGEFYFMSQSVAGGIQRELPTTGIFQPLFQVIEHNGSMFAMIEIETAEDITPIVVTPSGTTQVVVASELGRIRNWADIGMKDADFSGITVKEACFYIASKLKIGQSIAFYGYNASYPNFTTLFPHSVSCDMVISRHDNHMIRFNYYHNESKRDGIRKFYAWSTASWSDTGYYELPNKNETNHVWTPLFNSSSGAGYVKLMSFTIAQSSRGCIKLTGGSGYSSPGSKQNASSSEINILCGNTNVTDNRRAIVHNINFGNDFSFYRKKVNDQTYEIWARYETYSEYVCSYFGNLENVKFFSGVKNSVVGGDNSLAFKSTVALT